MLESILRRTLPLVALVGIACGSDSSSSPSCAADTDCKGDRICVEGKCEGSSDSYTGQNDSGNQTDCKTRGNLDFNQLCNIYIQQCPNGVSRSYVATDVPYCVDYCATARCNTHTANAEYNCHIIACAVETNSCESSAGCSGTPENCDADDRIGNCMYDHGWIRNPPSPINR